MNPPTRASQEELLTAHQACDILFVVEKKANDEKVSVTFETPRSLLKKIEDRAKAEDRPRSWVIRQLLVKALESQREKATA